MVETVPCDTMQLPKLFTTNQQDGCKWLVTQNWTIWTAGMLWQLNGHVTLLVVNCLVRCHGSNRLATCHDHMFARSMLVLSSKTWCNLNILLWCHWFGVEKLLLYVIFLNIQMNLRNQFVCLVQQLKDKYVLNFIHIWTLV